VFVTKAVCFPASLQTINPGALKETGISMIAREEGNRNSRPFGNYLLDRSDTSLIQDFGFDLKTHLGSEIEILLPACVANSESISPLLFESGSRLMGIEAEAFSDFHGLRVVPCLPESKVFARNVSLDGSHCRHLQLYCMFEPRSKLKRIEGVASREWQSLKWLCLSASLE
jgi:hypothetical protein